MKKIKKLSGVDKVIHDTMKEVLESQIMPSSLAGKIVIEDTGTGFIVKSAKKKKNIKKWINLKFFHIYIHEITKQKRKEKRK